jgi:PAS domain S-box-containing protein
MVGKDAPQPTGDASERRAARPDGERPSPGRQAQPPEMQPAGDGLADFSDLAPVGYLTWDADGRIRQANLTLASMLGVERDSLVGARFQSLVHEGSQDEFLLHRRLVSRQDGDGECEVRLVRADGAPLWVLLKSRCLGPEGEAELPCHTAVTDITERKEAAAALRANEERLVRAQEIAHLGSWQWDPGSGRVEGSAEAYRIAGRDPETFSGRYDDFLDTVHPHDRERVSSALASFLQTGEPYEVEFRIVWPDGEVRHVVSRGAAERDGSGRVVRAAGTLQDVTERVHERQALEFSHRLLALASRHGRVEPLLEECVAEVRRLSGCEAVGIRLLDEDGGIPYEAYVGFSEAFHRLESPLSIHADECMCVYVVTGMTDPQLPYYTEGGSFYMNGTTAFLATASEEVKGKTRNVCNRFGYETVGLVSIRLEDRIMGLIHMADRRPNMLPLPKLEALEAAALALGPAILRLKAEEALRAERDRAEKYLDVAGVMMVVLDADGCIELINGTGCELLGYGEEELLGRDWFEICVPPARREGVLEAFRSLMAGELGFAGEFENLVLTRDGSERDILWRNVLLTDEDGNVTAVLSSGTDVTERRRMERALQRSHERLERRVQERTAELGALNERLRREVEERRRAEAEVREGRDLLEGVFSSLNLLIAYMDADFNFLQVNRAYAEADGRRPGFFVGRNHFDLYPHEENERVFRQVVETGEPYTTYAKAFAYAEHPERGVTYWDWTLRPVRDAAGELTGVVLCLADVSDRVRAEESYRGLVEHSLQGVAVVQGGRIALANPALCRMLGYTADELTSMSERQARSLLHPDDLQRALGWYGERTVGEPQDRSQELRVVRKDGAVRWLAAFAGRLEFLGGDAVLLTCVDITERKRAEGRLLAYQRELRSLASQLLLAEQRERRRIAAALHDGIGQSLAVSKLRLGQVLQRASGGELGEPLREVWRIVDQAVQQTRSLTFDLSPPVLYELGLGAAVEWLADQMQERHGLKVAVANGEQAFECDEQTGVLMFEAVRELLMNVVKHAGTDSARVSIAADGGRLRITVADDGVGFNASDVRPQAGDVEGFGLFSIKERLEHVAGGLELDSRPGRGTRATITAPLGGA